MEKAAWYTTVHGVAKSQCPRFLKVKNWETDVVLSDTLHLKSTLVSIPARGETRLFSAPAVSTHGTE